MKARYWICSKCKERTDALQTECFKCGHKYIEKSNWVEEEE